MLAIIQARMSSARLPGKVLRELAGQPMLGHVCARLARAKRLSNIIVATSEEPSDEAICAYCNAQTIPHYRGSLNNVAQRFLACALHKQACVGTLLCPRSGG